MTRFAKWMGRFAGRPILKKTSKPEGSYATTDKETPVNVETPTPPPPAPAPQPDPTTPAPSPTQPQP